MSAFAWSVLASLVALLSLALGAKFEPTLTFVVVWMVAILILLPPYVLPGVAVGAMGPRNASQSATACSLRQLPIAGNKVASSLCSERTMRTDTRSVIGGQESIQLGPAIAEVGVAARCRLDRFMADIRDDQRLARPG
jgi:hypothetical protein